MKVYIKASLNSDLRKISLSSINGGDKTKLAEQLEILLSEIPVNRYILVLGNRCYNTGYFKKDSDTYKWLYNDEDKPISSYWDTSDSYIVLPKSFKPSSRIDYDDDEVRVWNITDNDEEIYFGIEDYEPMKDDDWRYCKELGLYYITSYRDRKNYFYIKEKVSK